MKIYVAGKWQERYTVKIVHDELRKLGHEITVDWTTHDFDAKGVVATKEDFMAISQEDIEGVRDCDLLIAVLIMPHAYKGLWVEMGGALILGKPVWAVGTAGDSCIFMNHPLVRSFQNWPDLYDELLTFER